ncbi:MAG TPA: pitrilysin family protein [Polyangia bacterium]
MSSPQSLCHSHRLLRALAIWLSVAIGLLAATAPLQAAAPWGETYVLPNGLRVILSPDRRFPSVTVFMRYHVGARHEPAGRSGIAHLVEHLTFRMPRPSVKAGTYSSFFTVSSANGTTDYDHTDYYTTVPSGDIKYALWKERWRMGINLSHVEDSVRRQELDVVRNERRQRIEIAPYSSGRHRLWSELFPKGHPYHDEVIGSMEDLAQITIDEVKQYMTTHYGPHNATLAVVGDFDPNHARAYIEEYFAPMPARAKPAAPTDKVAALEQAVILEHIEPYGKNRRVHMAWHTPPLYAPDNAAGEVLARLIGGMEASRIMTRVPDAVFHTAFQENMLGGSVFHIVVEPKPSSDVESVQRQVDLVVNFLRAKAPTDEEVDQAVRRIVLDRMRSMQDTLSKAALMVDVIVDGRAPADPLAFEIARFRAVTGEDVRRFAETYLRNNQRVVVTSIPLVDSR